ncbi:hypothetical protein AALB53_07935 [Lachnospiraceae bacterium 47-T17]
MSRGPADILDAGSERQRMAFTDEQALMKLNGQISRLLFDREKVKVNFR